MDAVTAIVAARAREGERLPPMLGASAVAHLALVAVVVLAPAGWLGERAQEPESLMTISLGGAPGPRDGGLTPMGGRPVQAVAEAKRAIEPVRPPAAKAPEMIEPKKSAPKKTETPIKEAAKDPKGRTPTKGEEVRKGSAVAETFGRGQGFGLSSGGGGTGSYLDTANFCCPEYITTMLDLVRKNWASNQQSAGTAVVKYTIQRDGTVTDVHVEKSSGYATLDFLASRALLLTRQFPPLPAAFSEPSLTVHLVFEYQR